MAHIIPPDEVEARSGQWLVAFPHTDCSCGWYRFYYAGCGHLYDNDRKYCCGKTVSPAAKVMFCQRPAPIANIKTLSKSRAYAPNARQTEVRSIKKLLPGILVLP